MKNKEIAFFITLSLLAVALSVFSAVNVYQMKQGTESESFKKNIFSVIDAYIAEKSGEQNTPPSETTEVDVSVDDDAVKGSEDAPITIVEFSDYQCPFCGRFFEQTLPSITKNYIDTGKVKYVFRDYPLNFHPEAKPAANAAECVREQGGDDVYYAYHDILYKNQTDLSLPKLKEYANQLSGIDAGQLGTCMDSGKFNAEVDNDFTDGSAYGVRGTPGFFILTAKDEDKIEGLKAMQIVQQGQVVVGYIESSDGKQMGLKIGGALPYDNFDKALKLMFE